MKRDTPVTMEDTKPPKKRVDPITPKTPKPAKIRKINLEPIPFKLPPSPESLITNKVKHVVSTKGKNIGKLLMNERTVLVPEAPGTPKDQIINDELRDQLKDQLGTNHHELKNHTINNDIIENWKINTQEENPFIGSRKFHKPVSSIDYSKYNEFVNNRTGKKVLVKLDKHQKAIKPKRLFVNELKRLNEQEFKIFDDSSSSGVKVKVKRPERNEGEEF